MSKREKHNDSSMPVAASRKHGATWWGRRWIATLEQGSRDMVARLGKGRAYARDGNVHGLQVSPGQVQATVTDDELESLQVTLKLDVFDDATWQRILHAMGEQALNAAQLLNGEMPRDIDQVFKACGKSLFPADHHEIESDCSCEDWTSPCKHVAATHYVLGDALDHDPFLLFELRGRSKEQVLDALDRLRAQLGADAGNRSHGPGESSHLDSLPMSQLLSGHFERSDSSLPSLSFNFDHDVAHRVGSGSVLSSLGKPASWPLSTSPQELLETALVNARHLALTLASGSGQVRLGQSGAARTVRRSKKSSTIDHDD